MTTRGEKKLSFAEIIIEDRLKRLDNSFLVQIDQCLNWKKIRTCINTKYTKTQNAAGASAYDGLMLFKILLLETWYGLNDRQIEERINDSLSFSRFIGLSLEHRAPDHSTISRFRTALTSLGLMDKLLKEINKQFRKLKIDRIKEGILVDATIVDSPNMPHRPKDIVIAADREDMRSESEKMSETSYQYELRFTEPGVDQEARWVKKGKDFRFGYKHHVATDINGIVQAVITTAANVSDTTMFKPLLKQLTLEPGTSVMADKGYVSQENRDFIIALNCIDGIMYKRPKGGVLSEFQKRRNREISSVRYAIERTFGSVHRWFKGGRARFKGLEKTHTQGVLEAIAYNIKRIPRLPIREN